MKQRIGKSSPKNRAHSEVSSMKQGSAGQGSEGAEDEGWNFSKPGQWYNREAPGDTGDTQRRGGTDVRADIYMTDPVSPLPAGRQVSWTALPSQKKQEWSSTGEKLIKISDATNFSMIFRSVTVVQLFQ